MKMKCVKVDRPISDTFSSFGQNIPTKGVFILCTRDIKFCLIPLLQIRLKTLKTI